MSVSRLKVRPIGMSRSSKPALLVYSAFFLFQLPVHAAQPLITLRLSELGVEAATIGVMLGLTGLLPAIIAVPSGQFADRVGPVRQAAFASITCGAGFVGLALAASPAVVAVLVALVGLGHTVGVVAYQSYVASSDSVENRIQAFGWLASIIAIAQSVGPAAAGALADRFSLVAVFAISAVLLVISLVGVPILRLGRQSASGREALIRTELKKGWWRKTSLPFAMSATLLFALSYNVRLSYLPLYLEATGFSTGEIGFLFSAQAVSSFLIRSQIGRIAAWLGQRQTLIVAFAFSVPVLALVPFLSGYPALLVASLILGAGNGIMHPVTLAAATVSMPRDRHGIALGIRYATFRFGNALSPLLLAGAVTITGLAGAFYLAAALAGAGAVSTWRVNRYDERERYAEV